MENLLFGKKLKILGLFLVLFFLTGCIGTSKEDPVSVITDLTFSYDSGIYSQKKIELVISAPEGFTIAYTTNGKTPSIENDSGRTEVELTLKSGEPGYLQQHSGEMLYPEYKESYFGDDPSLPGGKVIRAALVSPGGEVGEVTTKVYFLSMDIEKQYPGCLVISMITDPDNLLDYDTGILTPGRIYDEWKQTAEAKEIIENWQGWLLQSNITQKGKDWERPCMIQIFEDENTPAIEIGAGVRITGGNSRAYNQKSFNIYFRDEYGSKYLDYELFDGIGKYRSFRLKSGGNATDYLKFKEPFLQELAQGRDFAQAQTRVAVLFINGEYWGPYTLTEKITDQMLHDHYGVDKDQVIVIKDKELEEGQDDDYRFYEELMSFVEKDLTDPVIWEEFKKIMDIQSLADYCATRIYIGDADWGIDFSGELFHNDVLWRTRDTSYNQGKWQYILYDIDFSVGLYSMGETAVETDHFRRAMEMYPLFGAAIKNDEFYDLFLSAIKEIGSENFDPGRVNQLLDVYLVQWEPLMPDCFKRFGDRSYFWNSDLQKTRDFFAKRYEIIIPLVESYQ